VVAGLHLQHKIGWEGLELLVLVGSLHLAPREGGHTTREKERIEPRVENLLSFLKNESHQKEVVSLWKGQRKIGKRNTHPVRAHDQDCQLQISRDFHILLNRNF